MKKFYEKPEIEMLQFEITESITDVDLGGDWGASEDVEDFPG